MNSLGPAASDISSLQFSPFLISDKKNSEIYLTVTPDIVSGLIDALIDKEITGSSPSAPEPIRRQSMEKKPRKMPRLCPSDFSLPPRVLSSVQVLQDIFQRSSSHEETEVSDLAQILSIKDMIDCYICGDLKFLNPSGVQVDLARTYCPETTSWRALLGQLSIWILPLTRLSREFWNSPLSGDFALTEDDQVSLVQRRVHAVLTPLYTPLFSLESYSMTALIEGRSYTFSPSRCLGALVNKLPISYQGITEGDRYRKLLSQISSQDFYIIGLYVLLKLLDVSGTDRPSEVEEKCRAIFYRIAGFLRSYCMHKFGPQDGPKHLRALICLYSCCQPFENSINALLTHVHINL